VKGQNMKTDSIRQASAAENTDLAEACHIVKRAGKILIVFGVISLAAELDGLIRAPKGFVHLNITWLGYLVAGLLLIRGNLRAAAFVSWLCAFLLPFCIAWAAMPLLLTPLDLTLMQLRLAPGAFLRALFCLVWSIVSLAWPLVYLRREPVLDAREQAGRRNHGARAPVTLGVAVSVVAWIFISSGISGESAKRAKVAAAQTLGPKYKYSVNSIRVCHAPIGKFISASVTAYNQWEIRGVPVQILVAE
jgi:hypothetical protein